MKLKSLIAIAALALAAVFTGCSDDDWTPGAPEAATNPCVYFNSGNQTTYHFFDSDPRVISFTVSRLKTDEAIQVPVVLTADDTSITADQTISFEAGQQTAKVFVDCSQIPERQTFNISLNIPEEYAAIYAQGTPTLNVQVAVVAWETIDPNLYYYFASGGSTLYGRAYGELQMLDGTDQLRFTNFYGSGLDISFTLDSTAEECSVEYMDIVPLTNIMFAADIEGYEDDALENAFFIYNDATASYPQWDVPDGSRTIDYFEAFRYGYSYFSLDGYAAFSGYMTFDDDTTSWGTIWAIFKIPEDMLDKIQYVQ